MMKEKNCCIFFIAFSYFLLSYTSEACAATSSASSPIVATTTVAPTTQCQACAAADINLDPAAGVQPVGGPITQVAGCNSLTVTCSGPAGMMVYMDFNNGEFNPDINEQNPTVATFTCNANGMWEYRSNIAMQSYLIMTVTCFSF